MSKQTPMLLVLSFVLIPLAYSNCHQPLEFSFHSPKTSSAKRGQASLSDVGEPIISPFQIEKVQLDIQLMAKENSVFAKANSHLLAKIQSHPSTASETRLPSATRLVAVMDNNCVRDKVLNVSGYVTKAQTNISTHILAQNEDKQIKMNEQAYTFSLQREMTLTDLVEQVESDACVLGISNDGRMYASAIPNDPRLPRELHLKFLEAFPAYNTFYSPSHGITQDVIIAIVDSGVDLQHQDLAGVLWRNSFNESGFDFANHDSDPDDDQGHGTHVAGLVAAQSNNGIGIAGVMGMRAKIMAVKVLDDQGAGSISDVVNGIRWATDNGADVLNLSLGGPGANAAIQDAIIYAIQNGVTVIVAAGNDSQKITLNNFFTPVGYAPAIPGLISVGSVTADLGTMSGFSNYGPGFVEIGAPGSPNIHSTLPGNTYGDLEGTSMAAPLVTGAAALAIGFLRSRGFAPTPVSIEAILAISAIRNPNLKNAFTEGRTLNLFSLANYLRSGYVFDLDGGMRTEF